MAYIRAHETSARKKGKLVKRYEVCWREPVRDAFGVPVPENPAFPDGPKKMRARQESYPTRADAEARRDELNNAKHTTGTSALADQKKAGSRTYAEYARLWLEHQQTKVAQGNLKAGTLEDYASLLSRYVLDRFGPKAIGSITSVECEAFLGDLAARGLARKTIRNAWCVFRYVLKYAARHNAIPANPADAVDLGDAHAVGDHARFEHRPLTAGQIAALAEKVSEQYPVYGLAVLFFAYTGVRSAEMAGLEVRDLVFTTGRDGRVGASVRVLRTKERRHGEWVTGTPKSARSRRTVPLPPWLAERMRSFLDEHPRAAEPTAPLWPRRVSGGPRRKGERAVAALDWSEPCMFGTLQHRVLIPAMRAVGIPATEPERTLDDGTVLPATRGTRLHDLRHSFAALQLSAGTHYMQVSKWLGHASYIVTMAVYAEWIPEEDAGNTLPEPVATKPANTGNIINLPTRQLG